MSTPSSHEQHGSRWALALLALGVVYGDIGTSPLYALRECLAISIETTGSLTKLALFGPVSLMFWSLTLMVSVKYLLLVTQATNKGEGGVFALFALIRGHKDMMTPRRLAIATLVCMFGASLLYGDGIITPAISVLSAVEGLEQLNPDLEHWVVPIAATILTLLFMVQRFGTAKIGVAFGPVMLLWFGSLTMLGIRQIVQAPEVLSALSPHWGIGYLMAHGIRGLVIMGTVLLAVTGCEALYADIGHFGRQPLSRSWFSLVYPSLVINYLGQTALVLRDPSAASDPFFHLVPEPLLVPLIVLATLATIIASQAMLTGVFSLTQQAVQLGFLPRLKVIHTSPEVRGQIYLPQINFVLMVACLFLVFQFKSSSNLASAYGLSVSLDMTLTSLLFFAVARFIWQWPLWKALFPVLIFLTLELGFVGGSIVKILDGAWIPLAIATVIVVMMKTWVDGRAILWKAVKRASLPVEHLVDDLRSERIPRVPGTGVFLSSTPDGLPLVLLNHLKHNKALHKTVVLLTVRFEDIPFVEPENRIEAEEIYESFYRVVLRYGFAETPDVNPDLLQALADQKVVKPGAISFYQSRELLLTDGDGNMATWRKKLFVFLSRLARPATGYFELPSRRVIELGIQLEL